jgi:hypothetical protein
MATLVVAAFAAAVTSGAARSREAKKNASVARHRSPAGRAGGGTRRDQAGGSDCRGVAFGLGRWLCPLPASTQAGGQPWNQPDIAAPLALPQTRPEGAPLPPTRRGPATMLRGSGDPSLRRFRASIASRGTYWQNETKTTHQAILNIRLTAEVTLCQPGLPGSKLLPACDGQLINACAALV